MRRTISIALASMLAAGVAASPRDRRTDPLTGMPFVLIQAGEFDMGTPVNEPQRESQEQLHRVRLTESFYLGAHEVTQREWTDVMGTNPSQFTSCGPTCPVERVTFFDVQDFIERLNARSPWPGFRLPTEAEWEYACRAGGAGAFGGDVTTLTAAEANIDGRYPYAGMPPGAYRASTTPVETFAANRWGLFDMAGNVWEWTADRHCPYPAHATDPIGSCESPYRVIRGGSWYFGADSARCGLRYTHRPQDRGFSLGVRLAHAAK
jgi:formylglycine-generating enzyme required for sulfatase activity